MTERTFHEGDRVRISGDSAELWIKDYNVRVDSHATVLQTPGRKDRKVLVSIDYIDHDTNVIACVRRSKILKT